MRITISIPQISSNVSVFLDTVPVVGDTINIVLLNIRYELHITKRQFDLYVGDKIYTDPCDYRAELSEIVLEATVITSEKVRC